MRVVIGITGASGSLFGVDFLRRWHQRRHPLARQRAPGLLLERSPDARPPARRGRSPFAQDQEHHDQRPELRLADRRASDGGPDRRTALGHDRRVTRRSHGRHRAPVDSRRRLPRGPFLGRSVHRGRRGLRGSLAGRSWRRRLPVGLGSGTPRSGRRLADR